MRELGDERVELRGEEDGGGDAGAHDGESGDGHLFVGEEEKGGRKGGGRRQRARRRRSRESCNCERESKFFSSLWVFSTSSPSLLSTSLSSRFLLLSPGTEGALTHN